MKTTINRSTKQDKLFTIEEFAENHNLEMVVNERENIPPSISGRFYASFKHCDLKDGGMLCGAYGDGITPENAIKEYAKRINGELLVFNAYSEDRREIWAHLAL